MMFNIVSVVVIVITTAGLGGYFSNIGLKEWYQSIKLPGWTPPGSIIGMVWTVLYLLIGISTLLFLSSSSALTNRKLIIIILLTNAILNAGWSWLFFAQHWLLVALVEAIIMDITILTLIILIWPINRVSSLLLIPYALWVAFASFLTYNVYFLNR